ncbi:hypothetical protein LAZ67_11000950 [Cordylochernes scorpioides]|uniref:Reverse transcriptase domain-containing protein n=1 Tax=Cordylochernes scorpioides TaxID=51811 RepID=A0ABY6KY53_9ARAC|nr:hypothetical protein LAZ67_11000950 [Cordylochernes scorpioides]
MCYPGESGISFGMKKAEGFEIVLYGDLNVRTGDLGDFHNLLDTPTLLSASRASSDPVSSSLSETLVDFFDDNSLTILNGRSTSDRNGNFTFISSQGSSVIDLAVVSPALLELIVDLSVECMPYSDHLPLVLKLKGLDNMKSKDLYWPRCLFSRNMKSKDSKKFCPGTKYSWVADKDISFKGNLRDLAILPLTGSTLDSQVERLTIEIQTAMSRAGMRREIRSGGLRSRPWYDEECYTAKKKMKESLKLYLLQNNVVNKDLFITSKKKYLSLIKLKKNQYFDDIQNALCDARNASQFWKIIKSLKQRTTIKGNIPMCDWEDFYRRLLSSPPIMDAYISPALSYMDADLDAEISLIEVTTEISNLGKDKATGLDNIPNEAIKVLPDEYLILLTNIYNKILTTSSVPSRTIIHPIFKKGDPNIPSNYRGISLSSNLSKLFTSILKTRLNNWIDKRGILAENQAGFRSVKTIFLPLPH